jgi:hypothetical protein
MRNLSECQDIPKIARVLQDCGDSAMVDAEELAQRRDREVLMLRVLLRAVGRAYVGRLCFAASSARNAICFGDFVMARGVGMDHPSMPPL